MRAFERAVPLNAVRPDRVRIIRTAIYLIGIVCTGMGIAGLLKARLGTDPLDAINAGVATKTGLSVGASSWIDAGLVLILAWILGRRPKIGTVLVAFLIGLVINLGLAVLPAPHGYPLRAAMSAVSLAVLYLGVTGYVLSDLGAGCLEELMLAMVAKGAKIHRARLGIEAVLLAIAVALRGPINVVTVVFVALTGPVLAWTIPHVATWLRIPIPHHDPGVPLGDIR